MLRVAAIVVPFLLGVVFSSCLWASHVSCRGGRAGACTIDAYGLLVRRGHVEVPASEILHVNADERTYRRRSWDSTATIQLQTRTMGSIDLAGAPRIGGAVSGARAAEISAAIRPFESGGAATPPDVDLWLTPPPLLVVLTLAFALPSFWLFFRQLARAVRRRGEESEPSSSA